MEQTQLLDWEEEDDPGDPSNGAGDSGEPLKPVGRLHLLSSNKYGPEKDFWIYPGENVIGRLESCQICLPAPSVSKSHAVIEVPSPDGPHLLYDKGSLNRTQCQRLILKPDVRYSLQDGDALLFGDVGCQYFILPVGGASESSDESMEVPPTQARPDATSLAIEETPAPGRRMGWEGVLVHDSDKEEEGEDVVNGAGKRNGSSPAVHDGSGGPFKVASSMFSSPSAAVVPESDEENEEASVGELPCPSVRLCFESQEAEPGALDNGGATPLNQKRHGVEPRDTEVSAETQPGLEGKTAATQEAPSDPLVENFHLDSDTDVEDEEGAGGTSDLSASRCPPETSGALDVGSDTDVDEPMTGNPEPDKPKNHPRTIDVGSDTDVEETLEDPSVPQTHKPAENGEEDNDAEEGTEKPTLVGGLGPGSHKEGASKDVRLAKEVQGAATPHGRPVGEDEDSDTDVEEAIGNSGGKARGLLEKGGSDTDVDDVSLKTKNPDGTQKESQGSDNNTIVDGEACADDAQKTRAVAQDGDGGTDVEMSDLVLENSDIAGTQSPHPVGRKDSGTHVEETPLKGVVLLDKSYSGDRHKDTALEAANPSVELEGNHEAASEQLQSLEGTKPLENTAVVQDTTASSQKLGLPILSVDSDTDLEEEVENPDAESEEGRKAARVGPDEGSKGRFLENSTAGPPKSPVPDEAGDSDTDVEGTSPSHKELAAQGTDVDEVAVLSPGKLQEEQATQLWVPRGTVTAEGESAAPATEVRDCQQPHEGDEDTAAEGRKDPPADDGSNADGEGSEKEDDPDLAFQATQCFLPPEISSPMPGKAHSMTVADSCSCLEEEATQAFIFQSPPVATKLPFQQACSSPSKEDSQDPETYELEATQSFCQEPEPVSEEATQAFAAPEEEDTELVSWPPCEQSGGGPLERGAMPALPVSTTGGQQTAGLSAIIPEPSTLRSPSSKLVSCTAAEGGVETCEKKEDTEPAQSRQISSGPGGEPLSALQEVPGNFRSEAHGSVSTPEAGGSAVGVHHESEERSTALAGEPRDVTKQVQGCAETELSLASGRRRSQRLSSAPSAFPASVSEGRTLRRRGGSGTAEGSSEPAVSLSRRWGLRQRGSASQSVGEPEAKKVQLKEEEEEEEEASSRKKPRHGETAVAPCPSRARVSQRDSDVATRLKGEGAVADGSPATRKLTRRGKSRTAAEPVKEQLQEIPRTRASRRSHSTSRAAPSPKDSGKGAPPRQESPAPPAPSPSGRTLRRQSTERKTGGMRTQPQKRAQGSSAPAPKVLFTGVIDEEGEQAVTTLGGSLAESVFDCTHLVTDRVRRTVKFLCALARGIPIVTPDWLEKSRQNSFFLTPTSFLVRDPEQERNFGFSLTASLQRAQKEGGLFQGYEIHVTPNVKPEPEHMRDIVRCSGGTFLPRMPRAYKGKRVVISCTDDLPRCKPAQDAGIPVANSEFILTGLLQQRIDLEVHRLDGADVPASASPTAPTTRAGKRRAVAQTASAPAPPSTAKRRR